MIKLTNIEAMLYAMTAGLEKALNERDAERASADELRQTVLRMRAEQYGAAALPKSAIDELRRSADALAGIDTRGAA